jgi:hypothetical protein
MRYHYIYQITNTANGKIYIGSHSTLNLDDGYMGSGKLLRRAFTKYGINQFTKEILEFFNSANDMYAAEKTYVDETFVLREDTYNLKIGGDGGFDYINCNQMNGFAVNKENAKIGRQRANQKLEEKYGENWHAIISAMGSEKAKIAWRNKYNNDPEFRKQVLDRVKLANERARSLSAQNKRKATFATIGHQQGVKNSNFGKVWIYHPIKKICKSVTKVDSKSFIADGWIRGRKFKFQ